jgi:hypothetical protein
MATFAFHFVPAYRLVGLAFGVTPRSAYVDVGADTLVARFGPWVVCTPVANVAGVELTGPYRMTTTIGPAHLSLADRGLTFATNPDGGVCLRFWKPVGGIDPWGRIRHPGLTVTVADPAGLAALLAGHPARSR